MKDLVPIIIDLEEAKNNKLNESWLVTFGWAVKELLGAMIGGVSIPVHLKGKPADVRSFVKTLGAEKKYIQDYKKFGLDNPRTYKSKSTLDSAVGRFERKTGIKWPFK